MWGILGISAAYGVHWWGVHETDGKNSTITSSLPSLNPVAHDYMGATVVSGEESSSVYDLFALGILAMTVGIPYFKLRRFALKVSSEMLFIVNRCS